MNKVVQEHSAACMLLVVMQLIGRTDLWPFWLISRPETDKYDPGNGTKWLPAKEPDFPLLAEHTPLVAWDGRDEVR